MTRQKVPKEQLQHKQVEYSEPDSDNQLTQSEPENEEEEEDAFPDLSFEECYEQGVKSSDSQSATKLLEAAVRKYADELQDETNPKLAKYWLAYGDALLKREEESGDIFTTKTEDDDEDKKIAWESLDLARVCFHKLLESQENTSRLQRTHPVVQLDVFHHIEGFVSSRSIWPLQTDWDNETEQSVKDAIFTHLRLGDFCQNHHKYPEASNDFLNGLVLSIRYGCPVSEALSTAIPMAHCLMAQDDELTELAFNFGLLLIELEIASPGISETRKSLLTDTHVDFKLQLQEYIQQMEMLRENAKQAFSQFLPIPDDKAVQDLGTIGKSRKRD